ncbi:MAG: AMP-dependent synthetase and ligase [Chloroflexi bacterium]|nr:MAG: AMP-dependent synthetase and ligase [Chloroflexota bacterium]
MSTFSRLLLDSYRDCPDKVALTVLLAGQPDQPITYRKLVAGAGVWAKTLERDGIRPGEVVILILQHGLDLIYAYWGTILHGAIPSIMPFLTEKLLPERYRADLSALVDITKPECIITYREFEPEVRAALPTDSSVRRVIVSDELESAAAMEVTASQGMQRAPDDIVLLQHSSGTTGLQKGVALSHRAVLNQLESYSLALHINEEDVIVSWLPLYHDMGLIAGFLLPILRRIPLALLSPFDWVRSPVRLLQAVSNYKGTLSWLPNFAYNFCAQKIRERDLEEVNLSTLRAVSNCAEPMRFESHQAFLNRFEPYGLKASALCTCYAMAENVFAVTQGGIDSTVIIDEIDREALQSEKAARPAVADRPSIKMVSAGPPIRNVQVKVVDEHGQALPDRSIGELALRSDSMLTEYYHRPDATHKALMNGWFLTGDYGYMVGEQVFVAGRKKDMIIVGGKNVYPMDLEELAMEVPGVHPGRVVAFGVFNESAGTEDVVIVAEVDSEDQQERDAIGDAIRQIVTRGSAVALRHVYLVGAKWLIKTSSGKTARGANKEKYLKETAEI